MPQKSNQDFREKYPDVCVCTRIHANYKYLKQKQIFVVGQHFRIKQGRQFNQRSGAFDLIELA